MNRRTKKCIRISKCARKIEGAGQMCDSPEGNCLHLRQSLRANVNLAGQETEGRMCRIFAGW